MRTWPWTPLMLAAALGGLGAPEALGSQPSSADSVVIDGREFGPAEGLEVDVRTIPLTPGSAEVQVELQDKVKPRSVSAEATWGASYAISTETAQIRYDGKARAAANIYNLKRIVQVCIWYTRDGVQKGDKVCSNAVSDGFAWYPGPEVTTWCWDDLSWNVPVTQFNISTARIDPAIR